MASRKGASIGVVPEGAAHGEGQVNAAGDGRDGKPKAEQKMSKGPVTDPDTGVYPPQKYEEKTSSQGSDGKAVVGNIIVEHH